MYFQFPADFNDNPLFAKLSALNDCLTKELEELRGPGFCYQGLMVGDQTAPLGLVDTGRNLGVSWVRPVSSFASTSFPLPDEPTIRAACKGALAMEVEIGVARCLPVARDRNTHPDPQDVFEASRLYLADMAAMRRAVLCCYKILNPERTALGTWSPLEAAARVSGSTWQAWIG